MNQLWGVLIGGLIGLAGATLAPYLAARRDESRSRALVRAYLISLLEIAEARGHTELAERVLAEWRRGNDLSLEYFGSDEDAAKADPVANGDLLRQASFLKKEDAADLARFVAILRAVRIDLIAMSLPQFKALPLQGRIQRLEWTLKHWLRGADIAQRLADRL